MSDLTELERRAATALFATFFLGGIREGEAQAHEQENTHEWRRAVSQARTVLAAVAAPSLVEALQEVKATIRDRLTTRRGKRGNANVLVAIELEAVMAAVDKIADAALDLALNPIKSGGSL